MNRVLVALDSTPAAENVLARGVELAQASGGKVRLLRVVAEAARPPAPNLFEPAGDMNARIAGAEADLLLRERAIPEAHRDGVAVEVGTPWEVICKAARACNADVVVIGAHRYGLVDRVLGTTAAKVVNHIDRPVVVVRPKSAPPVAQKVEDPTGLPKEQFALLEAATMAGAVSGAIAGAVAGPPGLIVGGTIGTAIGMLAGSTLDIVEQAADAHDRELDDAIGVTQGDLGARESASAGLSELQQAQRTAEWEWLAER